VCCAVLAMCVIGAVLVLADAEDPMGAVERILTTTASSVDTDNTKADIGRTHTERTLNLADRSPPEVLAQEVLQNASAGLPAGAQESPTAQKQGGIDKILRRQRYASIHAKVLRRERQAKTACANRNCTGLNRTHQSYSEFEDMYLGEMWKVLELQGYDAAAIHNQVVDWKEQRQNAEKARAQKNDKDKVVAEHLGLERRHVYTRTTLHNISDQALRNSDELQIAFKQALAAITGVHEGDVVISDLNAFGVTMVRSMLLRYRWQNALKFHDVMKRG